MPYFSGDIILKVDTRANADSIHTRHHVMLVIGQSVTDLPIVAHLTMAAGKLVIETLQRGTELNVIHFDWDERTRSTITNVAEQAYLSDKYFITEYIIEKQIQPVSQYRPSCSLETEQKLKQLHAAFDKRSYNGFTPTPEKDIIMSCHEFVISLIHYVCHKTGASIPKTLQITPSLAWADCLYMAAKYDDSASKRIVTIMPKIIRNDTKVNDDTSSLQESKTTSCLPSFFKRPKAKPELTAPITNKVFSIEHL